MKILSLAISAGLCLFISTSAIAQVNVATMGKFNLNITDNTASLLNISSTLYENIGDNQVFDSAILSSQGAFYFTQQTAGQSPTELDFQIHDNNSGVCYISIYLINGKWRSDAMPCCSGSLHGTEVHVDNASLNNGLININVQQ